MNFRLLRADEIDCRVSQVNQYGVGLLLYKDARCDMNILDETVGALNWTRSHSRENANCTVSIWDEDKNQWVSKEDTGTESYTEKEKGIASDSFKRACFNWGIGRELYTAPQMFVRGNDLKTLKEVSGRWTCKDMFKVDDIQYIGRNICYVKVLNEKTNRFIEFGTPRDEKVQQQTVEKATIDEAKVKALEGRCEEDNVPVERILKLYKVKGLADLTERQHANIHQHWGDIKESSKWNSQEK